MTEPTRDALHAETLHYLEFQRDDKLRIDANRTAMGMVPSPAWKRDAEMYEYAAECVKRVPELEAEVEDIRAFASRQAEQEGEAMERGAKVRTALDLPLTAPIELVLARIGQLNAELAALRAEVERLRALHHDLIYEVGTVTPGETRHESAKRMLRQHETVCGIGGPCAAATREGTDGAP